jgi:hypothetical protein
MRSRQRDRINPKRSGVMILNTNGQLCDRFSQSAHTNTHAFGRETLDLGRKIHDELTEQLLMGKINRQH